MKRWMFMLVLAAGVLAIFAWNFPLSREFTYRYRNGLGTDLKSMSVNFTKDGEFVRGSSFFYDRGPGRGPVSQDHKVRLSPGAYNAVFVFTYLSGERMEISAPVVLGRLEFNRTLDLAPPEKK